MEKIEKNDQKSNFTTNILGGPFIIVSRYY
jgi:hypothetical protein